MARTPKEFSPPTTIISVPVQSALWPERADGVVASPPRTTVSVPVNRRKAEAIRRLVRAAFGGANGDTRAARPIPCDGSWRGNTSNDWT